MGNPGTTKSQSTERREGKTLDDRLSEATSKKTVSDIEETEKTSGAGPDSPSGENSVPSPDGTPDPDRGSGRADGSDTGGPM